jgi:hypothetical protein
MFLKPTVRKRIVESLEGDFAILKSKIRGKYKSKIEKYTHDIIMHVSDNFN